MILARLELIGYPLRPSSDDAKMKMPPIQSDPEWIDAFIERLRIELPNVSPRTLRSVTTAIWDDAKLRTLSGRAAAEHWLRRSPSAPHAPGA